MADWWATQRVKQRLAIIQKLNTIDRRVKMAKGKGKGKGGSGSGQTGSTGVKGEKKD